jgi:hypothetical protein
MLSTKDDTAAASVRSTVRAKSRVVESIGLSVWDAMGIVWLDSRPLGLKIKAVAFLAAMGR